VPEDYIHRIGRTGRAGMEGTATSLVGVEEQELMAAIEKLLKKSIAREVVDGFEPSFKVQLKAATLHQPKQGRNRGRKRSNQQGSGQRPGPGSGGRHAPLHDAERRKSGKRRWSKAGNGAERHGAKPRSGPRVEPMAGEKFGRRPQG
jgi:ATP-dependent RNA helicase RhlE